jgi:hypothetical protein
MEFVNAVEAPKAWNSIILCPFRVEELMMPQTFNYSACNAIAANRTVAIVKSITRESGIIVVMERRILVNVKQGLTIQVPPLANAPEQPKKA